MGKYISRLEKYILQMEEIYYPLAVRWGKYISRLEKYILEMKEIYFELEEIYYPLALRWESGGQTGLC